MHDGLQVLDVVELALLLVALVLLVEVLHRGDPQLLALAGLGLALGGLDEEALGALLVVHVRQRHAPVRHRGVGIERAGLTMRALGFEIPKAMLLRHALGEELLALGVLRRDREIDLRHPIHEHGSLTRSLIESLTVQRVAGRIVFVVIVVLVIGDKEQRAGEQGGKKEMGARHGR